MARTRTLAELEGDVLWQADRQGTSLRNEPARVRRAINQAIAEFREHVSDNGHPYYLRSYANLLDVGAPTPFHFGVVDLSSLSPAHHRIYGFDVYADSQWTSLDPILFQARQRYQGAGCPEVFFQYERDTVAYAPAADSHYPYLIWYLPVHADLVEDDDTFDGLSGWEEWVVFCAVAKLLLRDRDAHLERFEAERGRLLALLLGKAPQRQRSGPIVRGGRREPARSPLGNIPAPLIAAIPTADLVVGTVRVFIPSAGNFWDDYTRVGRVWTANAPGALVVDGVTLAAGDTIATDHAYTEARFPFGVVTEPGDGATEAVISFAADQPAAPYYFAVREGTDGGGRVWGWASETATPLPFGSGAAPFTANDPSAVFTIGGPLAEWMQAVLG
jgi:hypothetical protein